MPGDKFWANLKDRIDSTEEQLAVAAEALRTAAMWTATSDDPASKMSSKAINEALAKIDAIGKGEE